MKKRIWRVMRHRFLFTIPFVALHLSEHTQHGMLYQRPCVVVFQIWSNVQKFDRPNRMTFNVNDNKSWKPFFTTSFPEPSLPTVQVHVTAILVKMEFRAYSMWWATVAGLYKLFVVALS